MAVYFAALGIFFLVTVMIWFMAVALYNLLAGEPDLRKNPNFAGASTLAIVLVSLTSLIPFPAGYLLSFGIWWLAAKNALELPLGKAVILFLILAALFIVSRLAILGVLSI